MSDLHGNSTEEDEVRGAYELIVIDWRTCPTEPLDMLLHLEMLLQLRQLHYGHHLPAPGATCVLQPQDTHAHRHLKPILEEMQALRNVSGSASDAAASSGVCCECHDALDSVLQECD